MLGMKARKARNEKRRELRDRLWPRSGDLVWDRKAEVGFTTVPRTLPLIMTLINELSPKGKGDASRVYMELWSRSYDEGLVEIDDEGEHAYAAGYTTVRGVRTWRERMDVLANLGFIKVQPKPMRQHGYVLLLHPHNVVEELRQAQRLPERWYNAYLARIEEVGGRVGTLAERGR